MRAIEEYSRKVLAEAQKEAKTTKREAELQAKDTLYQMKVDFEKESKEKKDEVLAQRNGCIKKRPTSIERSSNLKSERIVSRKRKKPLIESELDLKKKEGRIQSAYRGSATRTGKYGRYVR